MFVSFFSAHPYVKFNVAHNHLWLLPMLTWLMTVMSVTISGPFVRI